MVDSVDIVANPDTYAGKTGVKNVLTHIRNGHNFSAMDLKKDGLPKRNATYRVPQGNEKKEAKDALQALENSKAGKKAAKERLKRKRNEEEAERLRDIASKTNKNVHQQGSAFSAFSSRRMVKIKRKELNKAAVKKGKMELDALDGAEYDADTEMLSELKPMSQMIVVEETTTARQDLNINGTKVKLEGYGTKGLKRSDPRDRKKPKLSTIQVDLSSRVFAYRALSEGSTKPKGSKGSTLLVWLEVLRNQAATLTTLLKETMYQADKLDYKERFSAESPMSFMEPQGANAPDRSDELRKVQESSVVLVLKHALNQMPDEELGVVVAGKARTTARKLNDTLDKAYTAKGAKQQKLAAKRAALVEVRRFIRSMAEVDISSDESDMSETEISNYPG